MDRRYSRSSITRRQLLRYTGYGSAALAMGTAVACGGSSKPSPSSSPAAAKATSTSGTSAPSSPTVTQATLNLAIGSEPETLDGDNFRAGTDYYFGANVYENLLTRD